MPFIPVTMPHSTWKWLHRQQTGSGTPRWALLQYALPITG